MAGFNQGLGFAKSIADSQKANGMVEDVTEMIDHRMETEKGD